MRTLGDRVVVICGASSGIGEQLALQLAAKGARLALCARRLERLQVVAERIASNGAPAPMISRCDVGEWDQVTDFAGRVAGELGPVEVMIANAGWGVFQRFEQLDPARARAMVETNLLGVIYCARVFLMQMLPRRNGRLVLISSVLGELPAPYRAVYGATKAAVNALAETLQCELAHSGVGVTLVEPGTVRTEFLQHSGAPEEWLRKIPSRSAGAVASDIIQAVERERERLVADRASALLIACHRCFPRLVRGILGRAVRRMCAERG